MAAAAPPRPHVHGLRRHQPAGAPRQAQPAGAAADGGHQAGGEHAGPGLRRLLRGQAAAELRQPLAVPKRQDHQEPLRLGLRRLFIHSLIRLPCAPNAGQCQRLHITMFVCLSIHPFIFNTCLVLH